MTRMDFGHRGEEASDTRAMADAGRAVDEGRGPRGVWVIVVACLLLATLGYLALR